MSLTYEIAGSVAGLLLLEEGPVQKECSSVGGWEQLLHHYQY